ncbi:GNAT family acetyltransferase [Aspergillus leporis]|jgi:GNAT superfamily N-acetyltransferase|uniref:GNAT family acetyltransferase n=1 Tax=Aspergillus leporis TaxID=41062 RepID=A0A5N5WYB2_9EURO|nr:GNAT family acetyltransferase [Aspergillus leporis]
MIAADNSYLDYDALPSGDAPELVLVPATPEERIAAITLNSLAWKGPLELDAYIARENHLAQQSLTKDDGLTSWLLVVRDQPEGKRTILSSCETYKKRAVMAVNGRVEHVFALSIGSVYCRPEFRGKGYAKRMMQELVKKMDTWQTEKTANRVPFSLLYSDIGKKFYAQFGWHPYPSTHLALPPISKDEHNRSITGGNLPGVRTLAADDVRRCMCNNEIIQKELDLLRIASKKSSSVKVAVVPDFDHYKWHWAREDYYAKTLFKNKAPPLIKGAGDDQSAVYCTWTRSFGETPAENTLYILRWMYDEPKSLEETESTARAMAALLRRAQLEAYEWNMAKVQFWNPTPLLEKAVGILDPTAKVVHREQDSVACLRWNGAEQGNDVEWFWNEKYAWC